MQQIGAMEKLFARTAEAIIGAVRKSETDMIRGNMCKYLDHQERMNGVRVFAGDWHAITQGCTQTLRKFVEEHTTQLIESFGVAQRGVAAMGKCIQEAELSSTTALGALEQAKDKNDEVCGPSRQSQRDRDETIKLACRRLTGVQPLTAEVQHHSIPKDRQGSA